MRSLVGISGYLLLGLYCIILCHNTLPHQHHISLSDIPERVASYSGLVGTASAHSEPHAKSHHHHHSDRAHHGHHGTESHHGHDDTDSHHGHHKSQKHKEHPTQTNHHDSKHHAHGQGMFGFILDLLGGHIHLEGGESQLDLYVGKDINLQVAGIYFSSVAVIVAENPYPTWIEGEPTDEYNLPPPPLYQSGFHSITPVRGPPFIS